jgi:hypothetical protein
MAKLFDVFCGIHDVEKQIDAALMKLHLFLLFNAAEQP